ncbi:MAG: CPBP family glutamic-type intramembrane protease [Saprospiraceae bacterium]|nr:CPBP family glutamic-type intramembrane protease [Saprospiraceae bacterium]
MTKLLRWRIFLPEGKVNSIIWWRFSIFVVLSTIIVYYYFPELLFKVVIEDPMLWIVILFIYTLFSVLPQEWLYRYVYVRRYGHMLPKGIPGTLLNGLIFSLAHLLFWNHFVLLLTFIGGCLFYHTYLTTRSLFQASLEHTLYGLWLFTLGIGDMLAFPG